MSEIPPKKKINIKSAIVFTRPKDQYECRIAGGCKVDEWIAAALDKADGYEPPFDVDYCEECPFIDLINKLADYEDQYEREEG